MCMKLRIFKHVGIVSLPGSFFRWSHLWARWVFCMYAVLADRVTALSLQVEEGGQVYKGFGPWNVKYVELSVS